MEGSRPPSREQTRSPIMEADIDDTAGDVDVSELGAYAGAHLEAKHIVAREEATPPERRTIAPSDVSLLGAGIESLSLQEISIREDLEHKSRCDIARVQNAELVEFVCSEEYQLLTDKYSKLSTDNIDQLPIDTVDSDLAEVKAHLAKIKELSRCELLQQIISVELHKRALDEETNQPIGKSIDLRRLIVFFKDKVIPYTKYNFFYCSLKVEEQQQLNVYIHKFDNQLYEIFLQRRVLTSTFSFDNCNNVSEQEVRVNQKSYYNKIEYFYGLLINSLLNIRKSEYENFVLLSLDLLDNALLVFRTESTESAILTRRIFALKELLKVTRALKCVFFNKYSESLEDIAIKNNYRSITETVDYSAYLIFEEEKYIYFSIILNSDLCSSLEYFATLDKVSKTEVQNKKDTIITSFYSIFNIFKTLIKLPDKATPNNKIYKAIHYFHLKLSNFKDKVDKTQKMQGKINFAEALLSSHTELRKLSSEVKVIFSLLLQEKKRLEVIANEHDHVIFSILERKEKKKKINKLNLLLSNVTLNKVQSETYLFEIFTSAEEIKTLTDSILNLNLISRLNLSIKSIHHKADYIVEGFEKIVDHTSMYITLTELKMNVKTLLQEMKKIEKIEEIEKLEEIEKIKEIEITTTEFDPSPPKDIQQMSPEAQQIEVSAVTETRKQRKAREAREFKQQKLQKAKSAGLEVIAKQEQAITSDPAAGIVKAKQLVTQSDKSLKHDKDAHLTSQQNAEVLKLLQKLDSKINSIAFYPFEITATCIKDIGIAVSAFFDFIEEAKFLQYSDMGKLICSIDPKILKGEAIRIKEKASKLSDRYNKTISMAEGSRLYTDYVKNHNKIWQAAEDASIANFIKCKMALKQYLFRFDNEASELNELLMPFKEIIAAICELSDENSQIKSHINQDNKLKLELSNPYSQQCLLLLLQKQIEIGLHKNLSPNEKLQTIDYVLCYLEFIKLADITTLNNFQVQCLTIKKEASLLLANVELKQLFEDLLQLDLSKDMTIVAKEEATIKMVNQIKYITLHISPQHFVNIKAFNRSCRHICSVKTLAELTLASEKE